MVFNKFNHPSTLKIKDIDELPQTIATSDTKILNVETKSTALNYDTSTTTTTINGNLQVITNDTNNLTIKPASLGSSGQALLSDGVGNVDFGSVVQNPVQSSIDVNGNDIVDVGEIQCGQIGGPLGSVMIAQSNISMNGNRISDIPAPILGGEVARKSDVDAIINDDSTSSQTETWSIDKLNTEFGGGGGGSAPTNSINDTNNGDTDLFNDGVIRLWLDDSTTDDIEIEIYNSNSSTSSTYHLSYTNFDGSTTNTYTTDMNSSGTSSTATLDFSFDTDEVMTLRIWSPRLGLSWGYYNITIIKSSSLYTGFPVLCSVSKS